MKEHDSVKEAKAIQKYSADYDMSLVIKFSFFSFCGALGALMLLEFLTITWFPTEDGSPRFLTPEILHSLFGYMGGWTQAIVTFMFGKKLADRLNEKITGTKPEEKTEE